MQKAVKFLNWSNETFTHKWDGVEYTFEPGELIMLQEYLAKHFAKHLAMREINRGGKGVVINSAQDIDGNFENEEFAKVVMKAMPQSAPIEAASKEKLEIALANQDQEKRFCNQCDSKGVRHKKECPTLQEVEFPELNKE